MCHSKTCDVILNYWEDVITQWVLHDPEELRMWLHCVLKLDSMSVSELQKEFESCFDNEELYAQQED